MLDRRIDPVTLDYVDDGQGGWEMTDTIETQLHHQLHTEKNSWPADPQSGSEVHLVPRKADEDTMLQRLAAHQAALDVFVKDGVAADLKLELTEDDVGRPVIVGSLRDVQRGTIDLGRHLAFGVGEGE